MLGHSSAAITLSWYSHYLPSDTAQLADVLDDEVPTAGRHGFGTDHTEVRETASGRELELQTTCEYPGGSRRL